MGSIFWDIYIYTYIYIYVIYMLFICYSKILFMNNYGVYINISMLYDIIVYI